CFVGLMVVPPVSPERGILPFIALVAAAYLVVALLDVITDGLAVRMLSEAQRRLGNAAQYGGYYGGSILSGGLFLAVEPRLGWGPPGGNPARPRRARRGPGRPAPRW